MTVFKYIKVILFSLLLSITSACSADSNNTVTDADNGNNRETVQFWLSDAGRDVYFTRQSAGADSGAVNGALSIIIHADLEFQEIDGFGFALTGGSALHIHNMASSERAALLNELFNHTDNNIGTSYLRVSIGASDLDEKVFSYDDLPVGQTDLNLEQFSLDEDRKHLIPVLKEILQINPLIKIMGSPWSPPVWMKSNGNSVGGSLKPQYYPVYSQYFVKYIQGMAAEGITIDAITIQNEPLNPDNNPSLYMTANQQAGFIKNNLGPDFAEAGIQTKIIIYDHNADRPDYPISILNDPQANQYIDGSAFHLYGGSISALSSVHEAHPDKNLYFTEQWVSAPGNFSGDIKWHTRELVIGATRNWSKAVIEWNLAADENQDPHTPGGCTQCLGALTISGNMVTRNPAYYIIAHASKFVRPGSRRISSTFSSEIPNVAFKTAENEVVIIVLNNSNSEIIFNILMGSASINSKLPAAAVGTYVWTIE